MVEITVKEFGSKMNIQESGKMMDICLKRCSVAKLERTAKYLKKLLKDLKLD